MLHAGIFHHIMANLPSTVPMSFRFPTQIHSSPPPSPPTFTSSWPQRTSNSKPSAFSIDAILGRGPVQQQNNINHAQSQQQVLQQQYQQHLQQKTVLENEQQQRLHHQQQQQQPQHHQIPFHRITRPAPYPSAVSSVNANDINNAGNNMIVNANNNNSNSSVRNNSNGGSGGKASKTKRIRTIFTAEQLERLEAEFSRQQYMVGPERVYLASHLQLSEAQVKVWFQNRRIKWRKQYMETQHARFQDHPSMSDSPTDRAESRSPTSPLAEVDAVSTHDNSDDDRVDRHNSVDVGSSSPPRSSSLSPPPSASGQVSRSPSPSSSESSTSSTSSSPGTEDNRVLSNCDAVHEAVSKSLNISYSSNVPPTLSHYLSVSQLNSSMMAVKDQLAKAQRSGLH